jgi:hypothetical protein
MKTIYFLAALLLVTISIGATDIQAPQAGEAEHPPIITITGKLGFEMYDGVKSVIINTNDRLVSGKNPDYWPMDGPRSYPAKHVIVWISKEEHKQIWAAAAQGRTVTLRGVLKIPERSVKLGQPRVAFFPE